MRRIDNFVAESTALADDLCWQHGPWVMVEVMRRAESLFERMVSPDQPTGHEVLLQAKAIQGDAEQLVAWANNLVNGRIHDQPMEIP